MLLNIVLGVGLFLALLVAFIMILVVGAGCVLFLLAAFVGVDTRQRR